MVNGVCGVADDGVLEVKENVLAFCVLCCIGVIGVQFIVRSVWSVPKHVSCVLFWYMHIVQYGGAL